MTNMSLIPLLAVALIGAPAVAAEPKSSSAQAAAASDDAAQASANPARRYCVVSHVTGSRIPHRDCRTRDEWLRDGFDPLKPDD